jgi:hypothetical protein
MRTGGALDLGTLERIVDLGAALGTTLGTALGVTTAGDLDRAFGFDEADEEDDDEGVHEEDDDEEEEEEEEDEDDDAKVLVSSESGLAHEDSMDAVNSGGNVPCSTSFMETSLDSSFDR